MHRAEGRGLTRAPIRQTTPKDKAIPHDFEPVTFYVPVFCSYCHDLAWTFSSGYKCKRCSYSVHSECQADVPADCPVAYRRISSGSESKATQNTFNRRGIILEGALWKMGKLANDPWIRVWGIVKPDGVYVFRPKEREYEYTNPILVLSSADGLLEVAKVNALHEHCFMLRRPGVSHYFAANSDEERKEWKYVVKHRRPKPRLGAAAPDDAGGDSDWANQSWIWTPKSSEPHPFGWEDVKLSFIKMLNTITITMNPPNPTCFVPELQLSKDDPVSDKLEVDYFRAKVAKVVQAQSQKRVRLILAELTDAPIPSNFPDTFMVQLRMGKKPFRVRCSRETNLKQIIARVLMDTTPMNMTASWALPTMEDYVVRCGGLNEFILNPDVNLLSIVYVRDAITKTRMIVFDLLPYEPQLHHMDVTAVDESPAGGQSFCSLEADVTLGFETCVMTCLNVHDVPKPFEVKVRFVENLTRQLLYETKAGFRWEIDNDRINVFVALEVFVGETRLALRHTQPVSPGQPVWEDWLVTDLLTENIPREARLCFTLCVCKAQSGGVLEKITNLLQPAATSVPVAAASITYANFAGVLRRGSQSLPMSLLIASSVKQKLMLSVEFDATAPHPIAFAPTAVQSRADEADDGKDKGGDNNDEAEEREEEETDDERIETPSQFEQRLLFHTLQHDALYEMTPEDKARVWKYRHYIRTQRPNALPKVLLAAPAIDRHTTAAIHALLARWAPLPPVFALELLGTRFADTEVRRFAVECLRELTDRQLVEYLPQLVQVLKSEPFHYSHLFEFLFLRSMRSIVLGHPFFWHLAAELHTTNHSARFKLMIEAFLAASDDDGTTLEMKRELEVVATFARLARELKEVPKEERTAVLREKLRQIELPKSFLLPYNPRFEVSRLIIDKCRVMDSMTIPLWLVFENSERQTASIIFKVGDDLRADILSLQMIRIMDQLWRNEGLDLHMQPYRAVSTGKEEGIIEVVTNAETMSTISQTYGGGGARSAFSEEAVTVFLRQCNSTEAAHREAVTNFTLSCAGYCVATYILGVGDRHNDNIMLTYAGHMFHIDFAYFLGRRVTFVGIPRETAPFVLTPDFVHAMGGPGSPLFRQFETHCCRAYNIIRRHGHLFITLFAMMVPSGMAQLQGLADLDYLRRALALELTDEQAALRFTQLIRESCSNQITQLNNAVHILAHS